MLGGGGPVNNMSLSLPPPLPSLPIRPMVIDKPVTDAAKAEQRDGIWTRGRTRPCLPVSDLFWGLTRLLFRSTLSRVAQLFQGKPKPYGINPPGETQIPPSEEKCLCC